MDCKSFCIQKGTISIWNILNSWEVSASPRHETCTFITVGLKEREEQLDLELDRNLISAKIKEATQDYQSVIEMTSMNQTSRMLKDQCRVVPCILQAALPTLILQNPREELTNCSVRFFIINRTPIYLRIKVHLTEFIF